MLAWQIFGLSVIFLLKTHSLQNFDKGLDTVTISTSDCQSNLPASLYLTLFLFTSIIDQSYFVWRQLKAGSETTPPSLQTTNEAKNYEYF